MKYRKKPIIVDAVQWDENPKTIRWMNENGFDDHNYSEIFTNIPMIVGDLIVETYEGNLMVKRGDWIIKGVEGELYPCAASVFEKTYEKVEDVK